jgi:hypothetical protein
MIMLHFFTDKAPWFRAKRFGYGAGLPFKWQGWVLLLTLMTLIIGLALLFADRPLVSVPIILLLGLAPMPFYAAHTEGGWKWRNGERE